MPGVKILEFKSKRKIKNSQKVNICTDHSNKDIFFFFGGGGSFFGGTNSGGVNFFKLSKC